MEQKTIQINPSLFNVSNKQKKEKKTIPLKITNENNVKRELIKKVKEHQKSTRKNQSFQEDFDHSMKYLKNMIDNKEVTPVHLELPSTLEDSNTITTNISEPVWGNLKNGNKPTYRSYMKTQKNRSNIETSSPPPTSIVNMDSNNNSTSTNHTNSTIEIPNAQKMNTNNQIHNKKRIKHKITRKKYTLGKSKTKKQINILIKDCHTKNKIVNEKNILARTPINEVKKYLYDRSFIKIGCNAPEQVLREMYESVILSGNVTNTNSTIMMENYFNV